MKRIIVTLNTLVFVTCSYAQLIVQKTTATQWVEDAVHSVFFLSRQSFQVSDKKTGELYGLNNKNEFGIEISLGTKVRDGFVLTDKAIHPWEHNDKYGAYREDYTPVPYHSEYAEFAENVKYDSLNIAETNVNELLCDTLYWVVSDALSGKGLIVDYTKGSKNGWVVWACIDKDEDLNKTANLRLFCYTQTVNADVKCRIPIETPENKQVLGGIYITPVNNGLGVLEFRLSGVMVESNGTWSIRFPFVGHEKQQKTALSDEPTKKEETQPKDNLTPVDDIYQPGVSKDKKPKKDKKGKSNAK